MLNFRIVMTIVRCPNFCSKEELAEILSLMLCEEEYWGFEPHPHARISPVEAWMAGVPRRSFVTWGDVTLDD